MDFAALREFILGIIEKIQAWFKNLFQDAVDNKADTTADITGDGYVDMK